jgi:hypothetical protein
LTVWVACGSVAHAVNGRRTTVAALALLTLCPGTALARAAAYAPPVTAGAVTLTGPLGFGSPF